MSKKSRQATVRLRYIVSDLVAVLLATTLFNVVRYVVEDQSATFGELSLFLFNTKMYWVTLVVVLFWMGFLTLSGYYNKVLAKSRIDEFFLTAGSVFVGVVIEYLFLVVDDVIDGRSAHLLLFALLYLTHFLLIYVGRLAITLQQIKYDRMPEHWPNILLIGTPEVMAKLQAVRMEMHYHAVAELPFGSEPVTLEQVQAILEEQPIEAIYMVANEADTLRATHLLYELYRCKLPIKIYLEGVMGVRSSLQARTLRGLPLHDVTQTQMSEMEQNVKWLFDRLFSLILLLLLSPLFAVLAILVRRSSEGPVFYRQERVGRGGKPFWIYKFRTMYTDAEAAGPQLSHKGDKRVTPLGAKLRKYRLDELPQFYNVLRGDMSIVGPRPERTYYIKQILERAPYYYLLHQLRPGITSWGMVRYGYASTVDEMVERLYYDWLYYEHMSIKLDLAVLLCTVGTIIKGKGK